jgi:Protein of unknown function (DUF3987)
MNLVPKNQPAFDIRQWVELDGSGRATCPACIQDGKQKQKNLSVDRSTGAYKCWRGCTPEQSRATLGNPKPSNSTSRSLIIAGKPPRRKSRLVSRNEVLLSRQRLLNHHDKPQQQARQWLEQRGFTSEMICFYHIGLERWQQNGEHCWSIALHIPANQEDQFYRKLRIAPWLNNSDLPKWSQAGVPATLFHTYTPDDAEATWFCEGEWDAMQLGWLARQNNAKVAVCCSTAGCGAIPPQDQLNELPGNVFIFFDRNDTPTKNGTIPGEEGARKLAQALGERGRIAQVPIPSDCAIAGWDVSDAIQSGFTWADFEQAAAAASQPEPTPSRTEAKVLRQLLEEALNEAQTPFQREIALMDAARAKGMPYRDITTLANALNTEQETNLDLDQSALKLQELLRSRPTPFNAHDFLEPWFAEILTKTAQAMPTAPEFLFTTLLSAAASRIGTAAQVVIKPSAKYTQPMVIWSAIVAQSGSMKTPAQRVILDPLTALEKESHRQYEMELEEYDRLKAAGETAKKPIRKRYLTKDSTIETLQRTHAENPRGILYYRDELAGAIKGRNQYRRGQGADEEAELDQWTGSAVIVDRAEKAICIPHSAVSRTGAIQWEVLAELMGDHRDTNGAWSRWLFCAADAPPRYLNLSEDEPDTKITETLTWLYRQLEQLPKQDYLLSTEAKYLFEAWQHQLVDAQRAEQASGLQLVYPKIEAYTARFALWLHIVNAVLQEKTPSQLIDDRTMEQAIELSAYYLWQHRLIHTHNSPEAGLASIALKIQKFAERVGEVSASRLKSGIRSLRKKTTHEIRQLMQTLAISGFGTVKGEGSEMVYGTSTDPDIANKVDRVDSQMTPASTSEVPFIQSVQAISDPIDSSQPVESQSHPEICPRSDCPVVELSSPGALQKGTPIEVWFEQQWVKAIYLYPLHRSIFSHRSHKLEEGHQVKLQINPHQIKVWWQNASKFQVAIADIRILDNLDCFAPNS